MRAETMLSFTRVRLLALVVTGALFTLAVGLAPAVAAEVQESAMAVDDVAETMEDVELWMSPLDNDVWTPDGPWFIDFVTGPSHGRTWDRRYSSIIYIPDPNYHGTDSFIYRLENLQGEVTPPATVTITVHPVNDPPEADWDSYTGWEDQPLAAPVLLTDHDVDGDPLVAVLVDAPQHGTLTNTSDGFIYTPAPNWNGTDSFTYKASDHTAESPETGVSITIGAVNDAPVANDDTFYGREDRPLEANIRANDTDVEGTVLSTMKVSDPGHGTVIVDNKGGIYYVPDADWNGTDTFTYVSNDGQANSNTASVTIIVQPANDAPVAMPDSFSGNRNSPVTGNVLLNDSDIDGDALTAIRLGDAGHGDVRLGPDGSFTYTPDTGWTGTDSFGYRATDGNADSNSVSVTIMISDTAGPELLDIYRFYNFTNGTHFYTPDPSERDDVIMRLAHIYRFEGVAYHSNPANNPQPLHRFFNRATGSHFYTADPAEAENVRRTLGHIYNYDGETFAVNRTQATDSIPVYRFYNISNGSHFYSADPSEVEAVRLNLSHVYRFEGAAYWLGQ